jgi:hypothetical protein
MSLMLVQQKNTDKLDAFSKHQKIDKFAFFSPKKSRQTWLFRQKKQIIDAFSAKKNR